MTTVIVERATDVAPRQDGESRFEAEAAAAHGGPCLATVAFRPGVPPHELWSGTADSLRGTADGPSPLELLLAAAASCVTSTVSAIAARRGIAVRRVRTRVGGDVDLRGYRDGVGSVRNGFARLRVAVDVDADASAVTVRELVAEACERSPVLETLWLPVPVVTAT